jgi:hypothetical protein
MEHFHILIVHFLKQLTSRGHLMKHCHTDCALSVPTMKHEAETRQQYNHGTMGTAVSHLRVLLGVMALWVLLSHHTVCIMLCVYCLL